MIRYTMVLEKGNEVVFDIDETGDTSVESGETPPRWLLLDDYRCERCAIPAGSRNTCPAALSIKPVVEAFSTHASFENIKVIVEMGNVRLNSAVSLQEAVRSMVGLMLALSSCPVMRKLRPMANFHLPFGDENQTLFRFLGMYLTAQYIRRLEGLEPDWDLTGLYDLFIDIHMVNNGLAERIRAASEMDATLNSLVVLDMLAHLVQINMEQSREKLKPLFSMYQ